MEEQANKEYKFSCRLTRGEKIFGWIFLPTFVFIFSLLISLVYVLLYRRGIELSSAQLNLCVYLPALLLVFIFMRKFLRASFDPFCDRLPKNIGSIVTCYGILIVLSILESNVSGMLLPAQELNPNEETVRELETTDFSKMFALAVFMAPIVEEALFRGLIFGTLREKSRIAAYAVTLLAFSFYHLWSSFVMEYEPALWVYLLDYIPAGYALCRCYEKTDSIWGPIFLHMLTNALSMWASGAA